MGGGWKRRRRRSRGAEERWRGRQRKRGKGASLDEAARFAIMGWAMRATLLMLNRPGKKRSRRLFLFLRGGRRADVGGLL